MTHPIIITCIIRVFLWRGVTFAFFHAEGNCFLKSERLNNFAREEEIAGAASFRSLALIPSGPEALVVSRLKSMSRTSVSVIVMESSLGKGGSVISGKVAEEESTWHCCRKKELKISALEKLSDICLPSCKREGIAEDWFLLRKCLTVRHQHLVDREELFKSAHNFSLYSFSAWCNNYCSWW